MLTLGLEHERGSGVAGFEVFEADGVMCCDLFLEATINLPRSQWLRVVRQTVAEFEVRAKAAGVEELRLAGRDWSRVLPDYPPLEGATTGLFKRL